MEQWDWDEGINNTASDSIFGDIGVDFARLFETIEPKEPEKQIVVDPPVVKQDHRTKEYLLLLDNLVSEVENCLRCRRPISVALNNVNSWSIYFTSIPNQNKKMFITKLGLSTKQEMIVTIRQEGFINAKKEYSCFLDLLTMIDYRRIPETRGTKYFDISDEKLAKLKKFFTEKANSGKIEMKHFFDAAVIVDASISRKKCQNFLKDKVQTPIEYSRLQDLILQYQSNDCMQNYESWDVAISERSETLAANCFDIFMPSEYKNFGCFNDEGKTTALILSHRRDRKENISSVPCGEFLQAYKEKLLKKISKPMIENSNVSRKRKSEIVCNSSKKPKAIKD